MKKKNWKATVYKKSELPFGKDFLEYWKRIQYAVFDADRSTCQGCLRRKKNLTVHHIISRKDGGSDELDNLITLCAECHDAVEELNYRSREEIRGFNTPEQRKLRKAEEAEAEERRRIHEKLLRKIDSERPSWHKKVYGSG